MLKKVLIANRAEIAARVIRGCKTMGVKSVAVYSDADAHLPYTREADEAVCIGAAPASESYLRGDVIIEAAKRAKADSIHPGYGFLSENAAFARAVRDAGLTFIGPTPEAMERLGSKSAAKGVAEKSGVPVTPWARIESNDQAAREAKRIGYPLIVKPVNGGGGKGMYRCDNEAELKERLARAAREAKAAFGSEALLMEKFLVNPRHIEVQILADTHGNTLHFFERECSIQRRNQKLIEESPSVAITPEQRTKICADAVAIAAAAGYTNAGTCEFLYDEAEKKWYFCEMNTRLQVEHPVTEMVTGVDLVEQQLRVASGEKLRFKQSAVTQTGHAMEFRIISEDPFSDFTPSLGTLAHFAPPTGSGVRCDAGFASGDTVSPHYDSLLAKLIVRGEDRRDAMVRAHKALRDFLVVGVQTCIPFHLAMLDDENFRWGSFHIHYAQERMNAGLVKRRNADAAALAAALMEYRREKKARSDFHRHEGQGMSGWASSALPRVR